MRYLSCVLLLLTSVASAVGADENRILVIRYDPSGVRLTNDMVAISTNRLLYASKVDRDDETLKIADVNFHPSNEDGSQPPGTFSAHIGIRLEKKAEANQINAIWKSFASELQLTLNERLYELPRHLLKKQLDHAEDRLARQNELLLRSESEYDELTLTHGSLEDLRKKNAELTGRARTAKIETVIGKKRAELEKQQLAILQAKLAEQQAKAKQLEEQQAKLAEALAKEIANDANNAVKLSASKLGSMQQMLLETRQSVLRQLEAKTAKHDEVELARALLTHESAALSDYMESWKEDAFKATRTLTRAKRQIAMLEKQREIYEDLVVTLTTKIERMQRVTVELWD